MEELLEATRNYLDITWPDPEGDQKLIGILNRGIAYLDHIAGIPQDYQAEGKARELLMEYARYVRGNALNDFQINYLHELLAFRIQSEVNGFEAEESPDIQ